MADRAFDISVVIPTYKRPDLLQRCLEPLLEQSLPTDRYEVIVVDDGQTEDTRALVENLAAATNGRPLLRYLRPEGTRGPAAARNRGWRAARGEVVAFTDDDTIPDVDWLRYGWLAMSNGQAAVRGAVRVPINGPLTDHGRMTQGLESAEFVTANCFVRRSALQAVDGFDERFLRAWREDSDLHFKLIEAYGEVPKASLAVVQHPVREAPFGISLKQQANMMFDALLFKKHPELYRTKVGRVHAPPSYYLVVIATLLAPLLALAGAGTLALTLLVLAVGLVLWLTAKRLRGTARTREHITEMLVTSAAIPFLSLYWRIKGGLRFRVPFF
jgi:glycosyltransferase involved in cell wall biosynthesis